MCQPAGEAVILRVRALFLAASVILFASLFAFSQSGNPGVAVSTDKGKLRILQDGKEVGTEQFELAPLGNFWVEHGETTLKVPNSAETRATGQLRFKSDGTPVHYDWSTQAGTKASGTVDFDSGTAKTSVNLGAKEPLLQDFKFTSPRVAVLDNNLYDQYAVLGLLYDWKIAGSQDFPVLIPQDTTPGSITI